MHRRNFLKAAAASTAASLIFGRRTAFSQQAGSHIEVFLDEPIATIAPEIYGHFTEHLGSVIYDGIYVGEDSKIPNQHGLRSSSSRKCAQFTPPWSAGREAALPTATIGATDRPQRQAAPPYGLLDRPVPVTSNA